jgi:integrase
MTWCKGNPRLLWRKVHKGTAYTVSCRQLRDQGYGHLMADDTKEGSKLAANSWWNKKEAELEAERKRAERPVSPMEQLALAYANLPPEQWQEVLRKNDEPLNLPDSGPHYVLPVLHQTDINDERHREFHRLLDEKLQLERALRTFLTQTFLKGEPLPDHLAQQLPPGRAQQIVEGVKAVRGEVAASPDRTVKYHVEQWMALQQSKVAGGRLSAERTDGLRRDLGRFRDYLGPDSSVETVDAAQIQGFYGWCVQKVEERQNDPAGRAGWSSVYAQNVFDVAKSFVKYLWKMGQIEQLPRNLDSGDYRFQIGVKVIVTWTAEELQTALKAATGQLRLHLLLAANCGFGQRDISDLIQSEVDWEAGRIIRKRSKTSDHKAVPTVNYLLWPETFRFLKEYRTHPEKSDRVLLTKSGEPWVWGKIVDGKLKSSDNVATNYSHLRAKLKGFTKPFKSLRKTGATLLDSHPEYHRFSKLYLGHAPDSIKDRHYVDASQLQPQFDAALLWLGRQLGQVEDDQQADK